MKLFIPEIGTKMILQDDWSFTLYAEYRNEKLFTLLDLATVRGPDTPTLQIVSLSLLQQSFPNTRPDCLGRHTFSINFNNIRGWLSENTLGVDSISITLPENTELSIDRIYIRKGNKDYSSVTFWAKLPNQKKKVRFWAKLVDVNKMNISITEVSSD